MTSHRERVVQTALQQFLAQHLWGRQKGCLQLPVFWCYYPCAAARVVCDVWRVPSPGLRIWQLSGCVWSQSDTTEQCPSGTGARCASENQPGEVGWSWAWRSPPSLQERVPAASSRAGGDAVAPQLCLCAGSAAGSVPAAVSLGLHPAVTWHRAPVLGSKVLVS